MAQIAVTNLSYAYEGSFDFIFENVSFCIDTNWKLGFIGRNGKGKTTFLQLLFGKYEYSGTISKNLQVDYFPYDIKNGQAKMPAIDWIDELKPGCEVWKIMRELEKLEASSEILYRPYELLSQGERTKIMLALLFSDENQFLLIDEPTNHLDQKAKEVVKEYLKKKKSFILVSHDRDLLDACIDHVLVLNRRTIEVLAGNFSNWWDNKLKKDNFAIQENEKHIREIASLKRTTEQSRLWAQKSENSKIGFDPVKEHDRSIATRAYIGSKTKKMQSRVKQYERRINTEIEEKEGLLEDLERPIELKMNPLEHKKEVLIEVKDLSFSYQNKEKQSTILCNFDFKLEKGERVFLAGNNGCGKSTFLKLILKTIAEKRNSDDTNEIFENTFLDGNIWIPSDMKVSYVSQDTSYLSGTLQKFCEKNELDESIFCAILRQLDMDRVQFQKNMEDYSKGQKKKVLLAASLLTPAHLYIWDEPLNYIDIFSRMQIENLILLYKPTMLLVDHDVRFREKIATRVVQL